MDFLIDAVGAFGNAITSGIAVLGNPFIWIAIAIGSVIGVILGALPGVGTTLAYALILPFTFQLDITTTIVLLMSVSVGAQYGNSIPAILVGVPGTPAAALTVIDGFALHKRGESGLALGIAFVGAVSGQIVSILFFIAAIIPLAGLAYFFLQPELFALYLFGLVAIVSLTGRNVLKGLLAVALGLLLAVIGLDPVNFTARFTFDIPWLRNGIESTIIVIGLLALSELLRQTRQHFQWNSGGGSFSAKFPKVRQLLAVAPAMLGGTVVGTLVGAVPGAGATPAAMIAYQNAKVMSKHPEMFGKGAPDGIVANEAPQNASKSGELSPALGLGIPGSGSMVRLLAALSLNGFVPGPHLVTESPELFYAVVGGLLGSSIFIIVTGWAMARVMLKLLTVNRSVVIVLSIATVVMGVYSLNYRVLDVVLCFGAGAVGYFMLRYGYSTAAAALAVVLAAGFEASLRRGMSIFDDDPAQFFGRPITLVILALALVFLVVGIRRTLKFSRDERALVADLPPDERRPPGEGDPDQTMSATPAAETSREKDDR
ncbi:tripartite tricarboxylate transporter permease [soil metagenome]